MSGKRKLRKFFALTLTLILVLPLSILAARWQWQRHLEREQRNALVAAAEASAVVPLSTLLRPDGSLKPEAEWRRVEATGRFRPGSQELWRRQPLDGRPGFIVVAVFEPEVGPAFVVERGWIAANGSKPLEDPVLYPLPASNVVRGNIRELPFCEGPDPGDLPSGQTNCPKTLLGDGGTFRLQASEAPESLTQLPLPSPDPGPHLGYVGQWILIGITAIVTYVALLRRLGQE